MNLLLLVKMFPETQQIIVVFLTVSFDRIVFSKNDFAMATHSASLKALPRGGTCSLVAAELTAE
jgi:hypothetical protein